MPSISTQSLRKLVRSLLECETNVPISANPNIEPLVNDTQLDYVEKTPVDSVELANIVASKLMKIDDTLAPITYKKISDVIDVINGKNEKDEEMTETKDKLRLVVRKMVQEAFEGEKPISPGPMSDDSAAVARKKRAYTSTEEAGGASFDEIAAEFGFSGTSGAKAAVEAAMAKAQFLAALPNDDRDFIVLSAMDEYIRTLESSGELSPDDVELLRAHPSIIQDLEGFREFMHKFVLRGMRSSKKSAGATDVE